jgi:DNA replication protein DnaC
MITEIERLQNNWKDIIFNMPDNVKKTSLAALLRLSSYPLRVGENELVVGLKYELLCQNVSKSSALPLFEQEISKILNRKVKIYTELVKYFSEKDETDNRERIERERQEQIRLVKIEKQREVWNTQEFRKQNSLIPANAFECKTFDNLIEDVKNKAIIQKCKEFVNVNRNYWMLTLVGNTGTSKTNLAFAIGIEVLKNRDVIYYQVGEMLEILNAALFDNTYPELSDKLKKVDLLILDDYGDFKDSETKTEKLDILIDYRYAHCMDTVVTTNKTIPELIAFNRRIASRLMEQLVLQSTGDDYRLKLSKSTGKVTNSQSFLRGNYVAKPFVESVNGR